MTLLGRVSPEEEERFYQSTEEAGLRAAWMGRSLERKPKVVPLPGAGTMPSHWSCEAAKS